MDRFEENHYAQAYQAGLGKRCVPGKNCGLYGATHTNFNAAARPVTIDPKDVFMYWLFKLIVSTISTLLLLAFRIIFCTGVLYGIYISLPLSVKLLKGTWSLVKFLVTTTKALLRALASLTNQLAFRARYGEIRGYSICDEMYLRWQRFVIFFRNHATVLLLLGLALWLARGSFAASEVTNARFLTMGEAASMGYDVPWWVQAAAAGQRSGLT